MSIRVYTGTGTSRHGSPLLLRELETQQTLPVARIDEHEMRGSDAWKKETTVLVFAGQSVTQFKQALGEDVLQTIREKVAEGTFDYIGICAGAAFASAQIKYRMKPVDPRKKLLIQNTGLALFNGLASGPSRSVSPLPFSGGPENLRLIDLRSARNLESYNAFHWGGPALIPLLPIPHSEGRFLSYLEKDGTPMSLTLRYGAGSVRLFSFHPEIHAGNIGQWAETRCLSDLDAARLDKLATQLDGTAFKRFLQDCGLTTSQDAVMKMAAPAATLQI